MPEDPEGILKLGTYQSEKKALITSWGSWQAVLLS